MCNICAVSDQTLADKMTDMVDVWKAAQTVIDNALHPTVVIKCKSDNPKVKMSRFVVVSGGNMLVFNGDLSGMKYSQSGKANVGIKNFYFKWRHMLVGIKNDPFETLIDFKYDFTKLAADIMSQAVYDGSDMILYALEDDLLNVVKIKRMF